MIGCSVLFRPVSGEPPKTSKSPQNFQRGLLQTTNFPNQFSSPPNQLSFLPKVLGSGYDTDRLWSHLNICRPKSTFLCWLWNANCTAMKCKFHRNEIFPLLSTNVDLSHSESVSMVACIPKLFCRLICPLSFPARQYRRMRHSPLQTIFCYRWTFYCSLLIN